MPMAELITGFFLIVGAIFLLVGSIGLFRLPDFYMRLHGPTKASTLGIGAILMASIVFFSFKGGGISISIKEFLIILFIFYRPRSPQTCCQRPPCTSEESPAAIR
jgi:multicomponent K+:H+ antiporter subunit G